MMHLSVRVTNGIMQLAMLVMARVRGMVMTMSQLRSSQV